jgi:hypothetical protein
MGMRHKIVRDSVNVDEEIHWTVVSTESEPEPIVPPENAAAA